MENMINFGIDLGTTNSAIAKFVKGEVTVFKDPVGWKETLPSVVSFRKKKIMVGQPAKTYSERAPQNVIFAFKRRMGTNETYRIKSLNQSKTPVELSAYILKELKTFVQTGEEIDAAVITIPAAFDTIQSNATKEAGIQAGFKQVVLLQEPIAASLAYANEHKERDLSDGQWLVYDLGGGTFDVALVKIKDGEMKILDHEGYNFLGGSDFDHSIVESFVIPYLEENYAFYNLDDEMKSASGKYNDKYYVALHRAEGAKIQLSTRTSAEIEFDITDDDGEEHEIELTITRSEFKDLIKEYVDDTIDMIKKIFVRNSLTANDIQFILMVGGSTYIPFVRKRVEEVLQIPVNYGDIEPTTAIAVGAAYYAGTKQRSIDTDIKSKAKEVSIKVRMAYQKFSGEQEEFFAAKFDGDIDGLFYRITREDGGFDTGLKPLEEKIAEDLPLVPDSYNFFKLSIYDEQNNLIETDVEPIGIAQGKYSVVGQPLPGDICLEVDVIDTEGETELELVFPKNSILPLKWTKPKPINKTVTQGPSDEIIRINVLEGPHDAVPEANKCIGHLAITGKKIEQDIVKGSDIEITLEISESRDLTISAYLNMTEQEFTEMFVPKPRPLLPVDFLVGEVERVSDKLESEIDEAIENEDSETVNELTQLRAEISEVSVHACELTDDDVTDKRFQLEDKKRDIAQKIYIATKDKKLQTAKREYEETKQECLDIILESDIILQEGSDYERRRYDEIVSQEQTFLSSNSTIKIRERIDELKRIIWSIRWQTPDWLMSAYEWLVNQRHRLEDQEQAESLIEAGRFAIYSENYNRLGEIVRALLDLLPESKREEFRSTSTIIGFY